MNVTRDRLHSFGWAVCLVICGAAFLALTFRVNAVKSQVRLAERQIVALKQQKLQLDTEFETRANQHQLKSLNDLEFGYQAPVASQYIEGERQLAALGKPRAAGAPVPIMVANADLPADDSFPAMVNPLSGKAMAAEVPKTGARQPSKSTNLRDRLSRVDARPDPIRTAVRE